jgi:hypothetical protein
MAGVARGRAFFGAKWAKTMKISCKTALQRPRIVYQVMAAGVAAVDRHWVAQV